MGLIAVLKSICHRLMLLVAVIVLNFALIHLAPGDPVEAMVGEMGGASPELIAKLRSIYGLDKSFAEQLWIYLTSFLHGDLGFSLYHNRPVTELILQRLPATLVLVGTSLLIAMMLGTLLGIVSARRPNGWISHSVTFVSLVGYSAPVFWTAVLLILAFASAMPIFPVSGMFDVARGAKGLGYVLDVAHHLVLPAASLAFVNLAQYARLARASMLEVLGEDYIRTARAKGVSERAVIYRHAFRNAMIPLVTIAGLQFGQLLAGAVLVETVFAWPGLGTLAYDSILRRDHPVVLGILFFSCVLVILANLITDLAYRLIDPRIAVERA